MIVDCMTCPVRGRRCDDCAVTALSGSQPVQYFASPELRLSPELTLTPKVTLTTEMQLDAAEHSVVSMFVGAGLVNAGTATRLRARRENIQHWGSARDVG
jgi:hypothetical protein